MGFQGLQITRFSNWLMGTFACRKWIKKQSYEIWSANRKGTQITASNWNNCSDTLMAIFGKKLFSKMMKQNYRISAKNSYMHSDIFWGNMQDNKFRQIHLHFFVIKESVSWKHWTSHHPRPTHVWRTKMRSAMSRQMWAFQMRRKTNRCCQNVLNF